MPDDVLRPLPPTPQQVYQYIQSRFYRSPEVILGYSYDEKIDMWSLACIMYELFCGMPLFNGRNEKEQIFKMVEVLDYPPAYYMTNAPKRAKCFFKNREGEYVCLNPANRKLRSPGGRSLRALMHIDTGGPVREGPAAKTMADNGTPAELEEVRVVARGGWARARVALSDESFLIINTAHAHRSFSTW